MIFVTMVDFGKWIQKEIDKRGWTQSDLSRESGIHTAAVSYLIGGSRKVGLSSAIGLSKAFNMPLEEILVAAGFMPWLEIDSTKEAALIQIFRRLTPKEQDRAIDYLEAVLNMIQRNS